VFLTLILFRPRCLLGYGLRNRFARAGVVLRVVLRSIMAGAALSETTDRGSYQYLFGRSKFSLCVRLLGSAVLFLSGPDATFSRIGAWGPDVLLCFPRTLPLSMTCPSSDCITLAPNRVTGIALALVCEVKSGLP
jgi:hypothetical protein